MVKRHHPFSVKSPLFAHRHNTEGSSSLGAAQHFFSETGAPKGTPVKVFSSPKSKHAIAAYRLVGNSKSPTGQSVVKARVRAGTVVGGKRHHSHSPRRRHSRKSHSPRRRHSHHHMPGRNARGQFVRGHH